MSDALSTDRPVYLDGEIVPAVVSAHSDEVCTLTLSVDPPSPTPIEGVLVHGDLPSLPPVGSCFTVYVEQRVSEDPPRYQVSREKAARLEAFEPLQAKFEAGDPVEGELVSAIDGGFRVDLDGVPAFLPASQLSLQPMRSTEPLWGQRFRFKIIRFDRDRHNVVLSRRVLLEAERDRTMKRIKAGSIVEGQVKSLTDFGAFVDLGELQGLLHISDISWGRIQHPSVLLKVGQKITVKVLKMDKKGLRISLGMKQLEDDPWLTAEERYPEGTEVSGMVVSLTDFGCFIELEPGLEGLVHSTGPMVTDEAKAALAGVAIGDDLSAKVFNIDRAARRLSLVYLDRSKAV